MTTDKYKKMLNVLLKKQKEIKARIIQLKQKQFPSIVRELIKHYGTCTDYESGVNARNLKAILKNPNDIDVYGCYSRFKELCEKHGIPLREEGHSEEDGNSYSSSYYVDRFYIEFDV